MVLHVANYSTCSIIALVEHVSAPCCSFGGFQTNIGDLSLLTVLYAYIKQDFMHILNKTLCIY